MLKSPPLLVVAVVTNISYVFHQTRDQQYLLLNSAPFLTWQGPPLDPVVQMIKFWSPAWEAGWFIL